MSIWRCLHRKPEKALCFGISNPIDRVRHWFGLHLLSCPSVPTDLKPPYRWAAPYSKYYAAKYAAREAIIVLSDGGTLREEWGTGAGAYRVADRCLSPGRSRSAVC
jgi:hypothetical protein